MSNIVLVAKIFAVPFARKEIFYKYIHLAIGRPIRQEMARPTFLTIEEYGSVFQLNRYTSKGERVGNTPHDTLKAAQQQAEYEFNGHYSAWQEVPENMGHSVDAIMDHLGIFEGFYRVLLTAECVPPALGPKTERDVIKGFSKRPWNKNVLCFWEPGKELLFLEVDHPHDGNGVIVGTEFVEELIKSLKVRYIDERTIKIIKVEKFRLNK